MEVPTNLSHYKRVLQLAEQPSSQEFKQVAFVAAAGIITVGLIGFVIFAAMSPLPS